MPTQGACDGIAHGGRIGAHICHGRVDISDRMRLIKPYEIFIEEYPAATVGHHSLVDLSLIHI